MKFLIGFIILLICVHSLCRNVTTIKNKNIKELKLEDICPEKDNCLFKNENELKKFVEFYFKNKEEFNKLPDFHTQLKNKSKSLDLEELHLIDEVNYDNFGSLLEKRSITKGRLSENDNIKENKMRIKSDDEVKMKKLETESKEESNEKNKRSTDEQENPTFLNQIGPKEKDQTSKEKYKDKQLEKNLDNHLPTKNNENKDISEVDKKICKNLGTLIKARQEITNKENINSINNQVSSNIQALEHVKRKMIKMGCNKNNPEQKKKKTKPLIQVNPDGNLILTSDLNKIKNRKIKYQIRIIALKDFFEKFIEGYKSIEGKGRKIIKNGNVFTVQENFNGFFLCKNSKLYTGVGISHMNQLKYNIKLVDKNDFQNSLNQITRNLRDLVISIGTKCKGIDIIMEVINNTVQKMKVENPKELYKIDEYKTTIFNDLDKNSFSDAGYTLGLIYGQAKRFPGIN